MMPDEVLHTDSVSKPHNLTAAEYQAEHERRAAELGDAGLHIIPAHYLEGHDEDR
jgi:hypothetical protein